MRVSSNLTSIGVVGWTIERKEHKYFSRTRWTKGLHALLTIVILALLQYLYFQMMGRTPCLSLSGVLRARVATQKESVSSLTQQQAPLHRKIWQDHERRETASAKGNAQ